jgi:hypothetical protein
MGRVVERKANCINCGQDLPVEHVGPFPSRGHEEKNIKLTLPVNVQVVLS